MATKGAFDGLRSSHLSLWSGVWTTAISMYPMHGQTFFLLDVVLLQATRRQRLRFEGSVRRSAAVAALGAIVHHCLSSPRHPNRSTGRYLKCLCELTLNLQVPASATKKFYFNDHALTDSVDEKRPRRLTPFVVIASTPEAMKETCSSSEVAYPTQICSFSCSQLQKSEDGVKSHPQSVLPRANHHC